MEIRLETPSTEREFEQWARIMERVEGDVYDVDELAHVIQDDKESAWILASRGDEALGCGVGRPSSIAGSLYAMARVLPEHRSQGVGTRLYEALSEHATRFGLSSLWGRIEEGDAVPFASPRAEGSERSPVSTKSCSTSPTPTSRPIPRRVSSS